MDLFADEEIKSQQIEPDFPLAARMRPDSLDHFIGQSAIIKDGTLLKRLIQSDRITSLIFYGPPGTGKTTLAHIIAARTNSRFISVNAVTSNVSELRAIIEEAKKQYRFTRQRTILFVDEIHRFNKAQQDILLPDIENNAIGFIGATTQNPSFVLTSPLVSRSHVFRFEPHSVQDLVYIMRKALDVGFSGKTIEIPDEVLAKLAELSDGDARKALNALDVAVNSTAPDSNHVIRITEHDAQESLQRKFVQYDRDGDGHYDTISAFIKSMRGSDPDATLYWLAKMLEAGEDPRFIARRIVIHASEDVGMADPHALTVAVSAFQALEYIGLPEARIMLAQAAIYIATAPKSNSVIKGIDSAINAVRTRPVEQVPVHLRDSHYHGAKKQGAGAGYKYPHDYPGHYVKQQYRPGSEKFYHPSQQGFEFNIYKRQKVR
ncbi:MAG: replication-associated recombination protein A [Candidatus Auribacter fodinae]|jgi:putative ATPase|uniref:Replication-associated recombination protein A n=1 Tax=Candidatus Auribacter fodinae TaxID=2093366 RepID=A0A3A4R2I4_9BACT|nr:MAG: replication-associated recombination protein A [Candidatus Auribacter fodinae]